MDAAYVVLNDRVDDTPKMHEYISKAVDTMTPYGAEVLVADESPETLEGSPPFPRMVIIKFPSKDNALAWYHSLAYQSVLGLRLAATEGFCVLADGLALPDS